MDGSNPPKNALSASAKEFSFNVGASTWTPPASFTPPPPAPAPARAFDVAMPVPKKGGAAAVLGSTTAAPPAAEPVAAAPAPPSEPVVALEEKVEQLVVEDKKEEVKAEEDTNDDEEEDTFEQDEEVGDEDPREHLNVVLIGHVDAGKSTLSGNLLYLMDMVDKRTIERYEREAKQRHRDSWFLAYIMDTGEEERAKGKTGGGRTRPLRDGDPPSQADVGILVISARKGEFETGFERGGQTREHAMLAKTLGINKLIVVINKMDEANWGPERFDECVGKLRPFLRTCGFAVKRDVSFIPVSGLHGDNVKVRVDKAKAPWYEGESLIDHMDTMHIGDRNPDGPTRVPILDRYADRGTIALGKVESGNPQDWPEVQKGFVLCGMKEEAPPRAIHAFAAQIALVDTLEHRPLMTAGYKCILHIHTVAQECTVAKLLRPVDPKTGKPVKKHVTFIKQGQAVICRIEVEQSITIETFANMPQLGRLTLRDEGKTIAIGKVLALEK
ncbi:hypothetical protein PRIC2_008032 [Phytophthora ramorum]